MGHQGRQLGNIPVEPTLKGQEMVLEQYPYVGMPYRVKFVGPLADSSVDPCITIKLMPNNADRVSPIYAGLGYLLTKHAKFSDETEFKIVRGEFESRKVPLMDLIIDNRGYLSSRFDLYDIIGFVSVYPRPVIDNAPLSKCPRCNAYIWAPNDDQSTDKDEWYNKAVGRFCSYSTPRFCLYCGQRFRISYKHGRQDLIYKTAKTERHITIPKLKVNQS